jgi:apolipoprotein N-acyltransferase
VSLGELQRPYMLYFNNLRRSHERKKKIMRLATIAGTAATMGLLHLSTANDGMLSFYPAIILAGTIASWAVIYRRIHLSRTAWQAALWAMWAGFWYFAVTIHWVGEALITQPTEGFRDVALAYAGSLGCTLLFFPWWGLAAFASRLWTRYGATTFAAMWSIADFLLGEFVYALPLGSISLATLDTPAEGLLSALGTHGTSLLIVWLGSSIGQPHRPWRALVPLATSIALWTVSIASPTSPSTSSEASVALVQLNKPIPVGDSAADYQDDLEAAIIRIAAASFSQGATLIAFPESTMLSDLSADHPNFLSRLQTEIPEGKAIIIGSRSVETTGSIGTSASFDVEVFNTAQILTRHEIVDQYQKSHLAIFGEYMPWVFSSMGFDVIGGPVGGLSKGTGLRTFELDHIPPFLLTICYEALMSGPMRRASRDADWILNISNEYLFGASIGPSIIQQYNRMRSVELGLPTLRATMTGHSGLIDSNGRVQIDTPMFSQGTVITPIPQAIQTPFRNVGYSPTYILITLLLVTSILGRRNP